ncbi:RNA polymerase sigma factor FliA [Derxia gummosa]|uniref:RNA polymerase sigma factor FliA n=1 Tax=Derxia gummosa DSM 723 TaxID=1121388 RepID=A0A8B6X6R4_9BURK|nr:RNA polymerase sigma factor FliA [Derxia gummosa]
MYATTGKLDKQAAIKQYAPLVKRMAHHMLAKLPANVELDDIVQAGLIGLMDAVNRYEDNQGAQFETYATQRIKGAMLDELRAADWLPRSVRKNQRGIESAIHALQQKLQRPPTELEIAKEMGLDINEYHSMLADARGLQLVHIEDFSGDEEDEDYLDRHCPDKAGDPFEQIRDERFRKALIAAIDELPERERFLMGMYYEQDMNFREIAAVLNVTESRVCQLHTQAVSRLRSKLKAW